jgi:hypothetical protein
VGLAGDAKYTSQRDEFPPTAYLPWSQGLSSLRSATFEVRTSGDPVSYVDGLLPAGAASDKGGSDGCT